MKQMKPFFYFLMILLLQNCVDIPDEVALPEYDVKLTIPIADRTYTLKEAVEDDSTNLKWSKDPSDYGLLYFTDEIKLERINVKNNLTVDAFTTSSTNLIGTIKLVDVKPIQTEVNYSDWGLSVSEGQAIFPEFSSEVNTSFTIIDDFKTATFENSTEENVNILYLELTNIYPVEITLNGLELYNQSNGEIAITTDNIVIPSGETREVSFSLSGKRISSTVLFKSVVGTEGSNGATVNVSSNDKLQIKAKFSPILKIGTANAKLPAQDLVDKLDAFSIDDSTKLTFAKIKSGSFSLSFENNIDVRIFLDVTIHSLLDKNGNPFSRSIEILRKGITYVNDINLADYTIEPDENGDVEYSYSFTTNETSDFRVINKNQGVSFSGDFSELTFSEIAGQIKPIRFDYEDRKTELDIGEFRDKLTYENVNLQKAKIKLNLKSSADVNLLLNGAVKVEYPDGEIRSESFVAAVPSAEMPTINFANLINNTSGSLPNEFTISGDAIVNPDYEKNVSASETDTVGGTAIVEIPLNAQVVGGSIIDTIDIEDSDIDEEDADRLNLAELTIDIENKIAAGGSLTGYLIDEFGNKILDIPPRAVTVDGQTSNVIKLIPAETDANGEVTSPGYITQKIQIEGEDVKKFIRAKQMIININFDTASSTRTVKFRYTDEIIIRVTAEATIKVSE